MRCCLSSASEQDKNAKNQITDGRNEGRKGGKEGGLFQRMRFSALPLGVSSGAKSFIFILHALRSGFLNS